MIITTDSTIVADGKPVAKNLKMNIAPGPQARVIVDCIVDGNTVPIDIVIYSIKPRIEKVTNIVIAFDAVERKNGIDILVQLHFSLVSRELKISGKITSKAKVVKVNRALHNIVEAAVVFNDIITAI